MNFKKMVVKVGIVIVLLILISIVVFSIYNKGQIDSDKPKYMTTIKTIKENMSINYKTLINKSNKLPDEYKPKNLVLLEEKYSTKNIYVKKEMIKYLYEMIDEAEKENLNIKVTSGYRTKEYQENLYNKYIKSVGLKEANRFSAKPRYSEHELGLAIDVVGKDYTLESFHETEEFLWMKENSYKYGFILRYPKNKEKITGYMYEPWHYRYLTKKLAKKVYESKLTYEEYFKKFL